MYYVFVFSSEILCIEQILFVISIYLFIILSIQLSAHLFIFYLIFSIYLSFHYLSVFLGERSLKSEISNLLIEKSTLYMYPYLFTLNMLSYVFVFSLGILCIEQILFVISIYLIYFSF